METNTKKATILVQHPDNRGNSAKTIQSQQASQPASQTESQPLNQPTSRPTSQPANQQVARHRASKVPTTQLQATNRTFTSPYIYLTFNINLLINGIHQLIDGMNRLINWTNRLMHSIHRLIDGINRLYQ